MADKLPFIRWFVGDISSETQHLSAAQLGYHVRLIGLAWRRANCSVPDNRELLCTRLNISEKEFAESIAPMIGDLWVPEGEDLFNPWLRGEREHAEMRRKAGKRGAGARWPEPTVHGDLEDGAKIHALKTKEK